MNMENTLAWKNKIELAAPVVSFVFLDKIASFVSFCFSPVPSLAL